MTENHPFFEAITTDTRYREYPDFVRFPTSESFNMTVERVIPYWTKEILPQIKQGNKVLIAAHDTLFTALIYYLEGK